MPATLATVSELSGREESVTAILLPVSSLFLPPLPPYLLLTLSLQSQQPPQLLKLLTALVVVVERCFHGDITKRLMLALDYKNCQLNGI